jgi:hypothetical protein
MTTVVDEEAVLDPHALTATTRNVYEPGPTAPLTLRAVVGTETVAAPVTLTRKLVGAAPLAAGSQARLMTAPLREATTPTGRCGTPVHLAGNDSVSGLDGPLDPTTFTARRLKV